MAKIIILKLESIKHEGESLGDDIRIELETQGTFFGINKKVQKGKTAKIDKEIGQFLTDQSAFKLNGLLRIVERDAVFNDVGTLEFSTKIDLKNPKLQEITYKVIVMERRYLFKRAVANFYVTVSVFVAEAPRYVADEGDGWLVIKIEDRKEESIPAYLRVQVNYTKEKREYFTVMEGPYRGKKASVKLKKDGSSYFSSGNPYTDSIKATYSISQKTFYIGNEKYSAEDDPNWRWMKGFYDIEIPDAPHERGLIYRDIKRAKTWFRIGHADDRYLHTGQRSQGCITIIERRRWQKIYEALIKARKGDAMSVGILEVID